MRDHDAVPSQGFRFQHIATNSWSNATKKALQEFRCNCRLGRICGLTTDAPLPLPVQFSCQTSKKTPFCSRPISAKQLEVSPAPAKLNPPAVVVAILMVASFSMKSPPKPCASSLKSLRTSLGLLHSMSTDTVPGVGGPGSMPLARLLGTVFQSRTATSWNLSAAVPASSWMLRLSLVITRGAVSQNTPPGYPVT